MRLKPFKAPDKIASPAQREFMAQRSVQSVKPPGVFTPHIGLNLGMDASGGKTPPQAATPIFSPPTGTYTSVQSVTISTTTAGATIRYTTDGSTPTETHGTIYSGPVSVGVTETLKAIAYKSGFSDSNVASASYTINLFTPATPGSLVLWSEADSLLGAPPPWADQSGLGNNFTISASPPSFSASGGPNNLPFLTGDGVSNSLLTADTSSLKLIGTDSTLVLIFKTTASDGWVFTHYDAGINNGWAIRLQSGKVWFFCALSDGSPNQEGATQYTINDGVWHMIAIRMRNGYVTHMVDGLPDTSFPIDQPFNGADPSSFTRQIISSAAGAQVFNLGNNLAPAAADVYGVLAYAKGLDNVELKKLFDYYNTKCATPSSADLKPYILWVGDSMFFYPGVPGDGTDVPDQTMAILPGGISANAYTNYGTVGATVGNLTDVSFWQNFLAHGINKQAFCFNAGSNNLATAGFTAAQTFSALQAMGAGFKAMFPARPLIVQTITPRSDGGISPTFEVDRQTYNALIRAQVIGTYWDAVCDVGNDATIGQPGDSANPTYYQSDQVHYTQAGAAIAAGLWATAIQAILP